MVKLWDNIIGRKAEEAPINPNPKDPPPIKGSNAEEIARREAELKRRKKEQEQEERELEDLKRKEKEQEEARAKKISLEEYYCLKDTLQQKEKEITSYKAKILQLEQTIKAMQEEKDVLPSNPFEIQSIIEPLQILQQQVHNLNDIIKEENSRLIKENHDIQDKLEDKQIRLESIVQTVQEDRYRKDKIKLINKYIYQMDLIRKMMYDFETDRITMTEKEATIFLQNQIDELVKGMEATLTQEMVERFQYGDPGTSVNLDLQESIDTVPTNNPELDGKVYRSINPGYVWSLPYILKAKITDDGSEIKNYRFLIRAEQVITYKLNK